MIKIGLFRRKRKQEIRADTTESAILTFFDSNEQLSRSQAMEIPTVSACVSKIGEAVSRLPIKLYRKSDGVVREITDDSRIDLLNRETGDTLSTVDMWKAVTADYFLGRGAWIFVNSNGINVESLHYVDCNNISILTNNDPIFKAFTVHVNERRFYDFQFMKFLRRTKDGFTNIPLQADNSKILSAAYNSLKLEKMMSANGGCKPGFLKAKTKLSKESVEYIKEAYPEVYGNSDSSKKIIVLNEGIEFEAISSTAAELQLNENKKVNSVEICKLFGFPHTIIDGGASEADKREFTSVVINFLNQIETELDRCLLLEDEKQDGYYWAFDTKELTRGSILERYQAYEIAIKNRFLQVDEVRQAEDYDPIGFNFVTLGLGDVLLNPQTLEVFTPNTGQSKNLLTGEERAYNLMELRYNHNHDSKGRFASGGRGGSYAGKSRGKLDKFEKSGIIETEQQKALKEKIASGELPLKINPEKQDRHILHDGEMSKPDGRSYLTIDLSAAQDVINKYYATGDVVHVPSSNKFKEFITTDKELGVDGRSNTKTKQAFINYSKTGTHLVPTKKGRKND